MASSNDEIFPAADPKAELNPGDNTDFQADSKSSDITTSLQMKEEAEKKKKESEKKDAIKKMKSAIVISAAVAAVAGAVFAIAKKLREK